MGLGTAAESGGEVCIPWQERKSDKGAKVFESLSQRFGRKVVDRGRKEKGENELGGSVVGFERSVWEEHGICRPNTAGNKRPGRRLSRKQNSEDGKGFLRVGYPPRNERMQRMNGTSGGSQWHPRRIFKGQHVLSRDRYSRESSTYLAPKFLNEEKDLKKSLPVKKKRPMSFCDLLWEEREAEKQQQRSEMDACRDDKSVVQCDKDAVLQKPKDEKSNSTKLFSMSMLELPMSVSKGGDLPQSLSVGKHDVLDDDGFARIKEKEVERQVDTESLELDNDVDVIDLRDESSSSQSPDMIEEISSAGGLTETSNDDEDDNRQQQANENEERTMSEKNTSKSWKSKKGRFLNGQAHHGNVPGSFVGRQSVPSTCSAWLNAAMAWRQKNMPTESELRKRKDEASRRASEAARMRNKNSARFQEEMPESGHAVQPIRIPSKPDADASESEWRLYFKNFHAARIASAISFVQVLRAFNVSCKDPENIKAAYMQAVRMYHPDSNSKLRTWSTDREKAEAEEIMKLINQRKPHEFSM